MDNAFFIYNLIYRMVNGIPQINRFPREIFAKKSLYTGMVDRINGIVCLQISKGLAFLAEDIAQLYLFVGEFEHGNLEKMVPYDRMDLHSIAAARTLLGRSQHPLGKKPRDIKMVGTALRKVVVQKTKGKIVAKKKVEYKVSG